MPPPSSGRSVFLDRLPLGERRFLADALRQETVGGALLLLAAGVGLLWANSPWGDAYVALRTTTVGPAALHLDLSLHAWAADGLLAIFFFIAGIELKRELVVGSLRRPAAAVVPVVAAVCGMVVPALVYLAVAWSDPAARSGWAVPSATDIAFALAVLAVLGTHLPTGVRAFLLTLAIVDDMGAILVIALVYTDEVNLLPLAGAAALCALYAWLQHRRVRSPWVYLPLALAVWALVHASGVHATVAGVALGLLTRVRPDADEHESPAERLEHRLRPLSAGVAVPVFALLSAGVVVTTAVLHGVVTEAAPLAVIAGLVVGKPVGVLGGAWLVARLTRAELNPDLDWADVAVVGVLAGIGFTVSLLIAELAFDADPARLDLVTCAVLLASVLSALAAATLLLLRNRHYRELALLEPDGDLDGDVPGGGSGAAAGPA